MSRFQNGQPCFSISCCHLGPKTFFRTSGSLTPTLNGLGNSESRKTIPDCGRFAGHAATALRTIPRAPSSQIAMTSEA